MTKLTLLTVFFVCLIGDLLASFYFVSAPQFHWWAFWLAAAFVGFGFATWLLYVYLEFVDVIQ